MKIVAQINKAVVGSGHGDVPKYAGEGMALCGTPSALGVPWSWYSCSTAVLGNFGGGHTSDMVHSKRVILFADVTSLKGTVMSYVMSQCCTCIGHVTFYYKQSTNALVGGSCLLFIHSSGSTLSPESRMWLVPNACRLQRI